MIIDEEVYLAHHGVKGMRWGVRNEERTANRSARREGKAKKFDDKAKKLQTDIDVINARKASGTMRKFIANKKVRELTEERDKALNNAQRKREGKLSTTQKKIAIGAGVAAAIVGTTVAYKLVQTGDGRRIAAKGKAFLTGKELSFNTKPILGDPNLTSTQIHDLVAKKVNPEYGKMGSKMNCRRCTFAYELRRRGMDVEATRTTTASGQNVVGLANALTPGENVKATGKIPVAARLVKEAVELNKNPNANAPLMTMSRTGPAGALSKIDGMGVRPIFDALKQQPDRSRGEVAVSWIGGGAHSMAYEIINGVPHIFDTQSGKKYSSPEELAKIGAVVAQSGFTRLDNVPLNVDYLARWVKNA